MDNNQVNVQQPQMKRTPKWVIGLIIGGIAAFSILTVVAVVILFSSSVGDFYGKWDCNGITLELDSKNFDMYTADKKTLFVNANYTIKELKDKNSGKSMTINVSTNKRIIGGKTYTSSYTTQFELMVSKDDKDSMVMMNTVTYSIYSCKKVK